MTLDDRSNETDQHTDGELLALSRGGDESAYAELWRRYSVAAQRAARNIVGPADAEDVVSEAFAEIFRLIQAGKGPQQVFGPYLLATVHNRSIRWSQRKRRFIVDPLDDASADIHEPASVSRENSQLLLSLFHALPERWQEVLWRTEVARDARREIGQEMGISAHGVATLAARARAGLREAWFQAHVNEATAPGRCKENLARMGAFRANRLSLRRRLQVEQHLRECPDCSRASAEMETAASDLYTVLLPALGLWGMHELVSPIVASESAMAASAQTLPGGSAAGTPAGIVGAALPVISGVAAVAVLGAAVVLPQIVPDAPRFTKSVAVQEKPKAEDQDSPDRASSDRPVTAGTTAEGDESATAAVGAVWVYRSPVIFDFPSGTVFSTEHPVLSGVSQGRTDLVLTLSAFGQQARDIPVVASRDGRWTVRTGSLAPGNYLLVAQQVGRDGVEAGVKSRVWFTVDTSQKVAEPEVRQVDTGGGLFRPLIKGVGQPGATIEVAINDRTVRLTVAEDGSWTLLDTHFAVVGSNSLFVTQIVADSRDPLTKESQRAVSDTTEFYLQGPLATVRTGGEFGRTIEVEFLPGARVSLVSSDRTFSHQISNDLGFGAVEVRSLRDPRATGSVGLRYTTSDESRQGPTVELPW